mgnify:CR=1 FL=1
MTGSPTEERLAALTTQWSAAHDLRAAFADCYRVMTVRMTEGVESEVFHDPLWVTRLRDRFADYYFDACECDVCVRFCDVVG